MVSKISEILDSKRQKEVVRPEWRVGMKILCGSERGVVIAVEQERVIAAALGDASHLREFGLGGDGWLPGHWEEDRERSELTSTEAAGNRQNWAGFAAGGPTDRENLQWAIARRYSGRAQWTRENAKRLAALAVTVVTAGPEKSSLEILKLLEYYQYQEASEAAARSYENKLKYQRF